MIVSARDPAKSVLENSSSSSARCTASPKQKVPHRVLVAKSRETVAVQVAQLVPPLLPASRKSELDPTQKGGLEYPRTHSPSRQCMSSRNEDTSQTFVSK
jgi:hypothetical protein